MRKARHTSFPLILNNECIIAFSNRNDNANTQVNNIKYLIQKQTTDLLITNSVKHEYQHHTNAYKMFAI